MAYDESSIQHLTGVAALRAKPQMYIGPTDAHGLFTLLREVGDNGVDEALAGHCSRIGIVIDDSSGDRIYTVVDDGRGMPVGDMSVKDSVTSKSVRIPAIQAITSLLHAGGKLSRGDGDSAYRVSIGCFAPEVRIRLLDDTVVTFEELHRRWTKNKRPIPVLSYNTKKKRLEPSEITFSQITKRTRHLVEVEFDNGHTVRVTPNHPFYVRKGGSVKAVPAGRLKEGDSLVSTYYPDVTSGVHRGYAHATEDGRMKVLHRLVGSFDLQARRFNELEANTHVHHKNKNIRDARPSNLEVMSTADHHREHSASRSDFARTQIVETQRELRSENSVRFARQNATDTHKWTSSRTRIVSVALQALLRYGKVTRSTYEASRRHTQPRFDTAIEYFYGIDELRTLACERRELLESKTGRSPKAEDELDGLKGTQLTAEESARRASRQSSFNAWKKHLLSFEDPMSVTPAQWNAGRKGAFKMGNSAYANLCAFTSLRAVKRHVLLGEALSTYEDMSEAAVSRRRAFGELRAATSQKRLSFVSYSMKMLRPYFEDGYSEDRHRRLSSKQGNLPDPLLFKVFLADHLGIDLNDCSDDVVSDAMFSWNHSVAAVREVTLDTPIPVYDITVDHTHTFFIEAGPGRLGKKLAPSSGVLVSNSHGVGIKATNFLSSWFRVFTFNKGSWWTIEYHEGELAVPLTKLAKPPRDPINPTQPLKSGTVVSFQPNLDFFSANKFPPSMLAEWATMKAYFTPGLTLDVKIKDKLVTLHFPDGVSQYIADRVAALNVEVNGDPFTYSSPLVDCLFTFSSYDGCEMSAFTNGLQNLDRGTHFDTFFKTLMEVVTPLAPKTKDGKLPFTVAELREGMIGVVNIKLSSPQFGGQTKEKLVDTRGQEPLAEDLKGPLTKWVKANGPLLKSVIEKAIRLKELKGKFAVSKTAINKIRAAGKKGFSPKAAIALNCPSEKRELFLVEGDSALGCFLGDTKVRLINGVSVRFDEMADRAERGEVFYGYAYDRKAETAAVIKFDTPRLTKHVTEYAEVELSTGEILRCTLDHPWLTRDNTYVAAADLQAGQSLMTFAEEKEDGRRIVVVPMRGNRFPGRKRFVYDLVARLKKKNRFLLDSGDGYQVHHKDHDRSNDHPSNLEVITTAAHLLEHYDERVATEGVKAVGIRHARRLETDPAYLRRCQEHSSELMSEFWSRSENRVAQSQRIKEHYQKAGSRRATSLATSAGMRGVWLALAARCSDPFDDAEFESVKLQLGTRTVLRAKSWSRYFKSKREAMRHILQVIRATNG